MPLSLRLFPEWVSAADEWNAPADAEAMPEGDALPASLAAAVPKRQREFLAGRRAARRALIGLDLAYGTAALEREPDGSARWPAGVVGSITHTRGYVAAVAAPAARALAIGLDAEARLDTDRADRVRSRIATADELDDLARAAALDAADAVTVIFSAKEALYKCLASRVGQRFGHLDARVTAAPSPGGFVATLERTLSDEWRAGTSVHGRFDCTAHLIRAGIVLVARR